MSMNWADVYGEEASPLQMASPISAAGPNQSFVNPAFSGAGTMLEQSTGPAPAFSLLGLVLLLVAWRVFVQLNEE